MVSFAESLDGIRMVDWLCVSDHVHQVCKGPHEIVAINLDPYEKLLYSTAQITHVPIM